MKIKQMLCVLLAVALLLTAFPTAFAAENSFVEPFTDLHPRTNRDIPLPLSSDATAGDGVRYGVFDLRGVLCRRCVQHGKLRCGDLCNQ